MLSQELEFCLNDAFAGAREARHEFMTVEHLLLAIVDTPKVREVLKSCGADASKLKSELKQFIDQTTPRLPAGEDRDVQPTLGFQRVLQRAVFHVQSSGKKEVTVANVLVAIFSEKQSHAAYLLSMQDVDHEFHGRVVVIDQQYLILRRALELGRRFLDDQTRTFPSSFNVTHELPVYRAHFPALQAPDPKPAT